MAVANDSGYLAGTLLPIVAADAIVQLGKVGVTRNLVTVKSAPRADTISWGVYNDSTHQTTSADVVATAEGTVTPSTKLQSTKKTATLDMYSVMLPLYDEALLSSADDVVGNLGEIIGNAVAGKIDSLLNANFDNFSNSVGTSTTGMKLTDLMSALALLELYKSAGQVNLVAHAAQLWGTYGLFNDSAITTQFGGTPMVAEQILANGYVNKLAGINIYNSNEISETSSARKAGIFTKEAIGWGFAGDEIRLKSQDEANYIRTNFVASGFWGTTELRDTAGVEVHSKTS